MSKTLVPTLNDAELIEKCSELISDFCQNGSKSRIWYMSIPARPNEDADCLFTELIERFRRLSEPTEGEKK